MRSFNKTMLRNRDGKNLSESVFQLAGPAANCCQSRLYQGITEPLSGVSEAVRSKEPLPIDVVLHFSDGAKAVGTGNLDLGFSRPGGGVVNVYNPLQRASGHFGEAAESVELAGERLHVASWEKLAGSQVDLRIMSQSPQTYVQSLERNWEDGDVTTYAIKMADGTRINGMRDGKGALGFFEGRDKWRLWSQQTRVATNDFLVSSVNHIDSIRDRMNRTADMLRGK